MLSSPARLSPFARSHFVPSGGGFVPTDIAGCLLWLDAGQITGLSDGAPISSWLDASGNANHAIQVVGANQPLYKTGILNGLPVTRWDGSNDTMLSAVASAQPYTIFLVAIADFAGNIVPFASGTSVYVAGFSGSSGQINAGATLSFSCAPTSWTGYSFVCNGASSLVSVNGVVTNGSVGGNAFSGMNLAAYAGSSNFWDGDIAEIIFYNSALGTTDRQTVESYLAAKYAL